METSAVSLGEFGPAPRFTSAIKSAEIQMKDATCPDRTSFAISVADFMLALQRIDATDGPVAGEHSFFRGASLAHYDDETRRCLRAWPDRIDAERASAVWDAALGPSWERAPVWFHGDLAIGNLLVQHDQLRAVIDFGTCGVGDPACDYVIAWTFFRGRNRGHVS